MNNEIRIAMLGLDTSHVEAFAKLLHCPEEEYHVPGARIVRAWSGGSEDFPLSRDRVEGYTRLLREDYGVKICENIDQTVADVDAIMITAVDGRVHPELLGAVLSKGKPVYIDKPFATSTEEAERMVDQADAAGCPLMSCSSLRYAAGLQNILEEKSRADLFGADIFGPMAIEAPLPGYYWYGIHTAEMLVAAFGAGLKGVSVRNNDSHDVIVAEWKDGRIGTLRGNRVGNQRFGGVLHWSDESRFVDVYAHAKPYYANLLEAILPFFRRGESPVPIQETLDVIRLLDEANAGRR